MTISVLKLQMVIIIIWLIDTNLIMYSKIWNYE